MPSTVHAFLYECTHTSFDRSFLELSKSIKIFLFGSYIQGVIKKLTVIFKSCVLSMFDFLIFFSVMLLHMAVIYFDNISHFGLSVCFKEIKRLIVFCCVLRFFTFRKNRSKKTVLNVKN